MPEYHIPETLIKYYACNKNSSDALLNSYLWASYPLQFNDPFDCSEKLWELGDFSSKAIANFMKTEIHFLFEKCMSNEERRRRFIQLMAPGIICLNEYKRDIEDILWGYYTNQEGFAVEFDSNKLIEKWNVIPQHVRYEPYMDLIDRFRVRNYKQDFKEWALIKKKIWDQEDEWRFLFTDCNSYHPILKIGDNKVRQKKYDSNSIRNVILGYRFLPTPHYSDVHNRTYIFKGDLDENYSYKILKFLFKNTNISIKQILLKNDFTLSYQKVYVKEIHDNEVTIVNE